MSSAVPNDDEKGIPDSGNQADNNNSANGGQAPRVVVNDQGDELGDYIPPERPETCAACTVMEA